MQRQSRSGRAVAKGGFLNLPPVATPALGGGGGEDFGDAPLARSRALARPPDHDSVAWGDTAVPTRGSGLSPSPRRGLASPLASATEGVPPTSCPARPPSPRPLCRQRSVARPGAHCPKVGRFRTKSLCPPQPLHPTMCSQKRGGRKKFHATQEAARPSPRLQRSAPPGPPHPPGTPRTQRGPPRTPKAGGFPAPPTSGRSEQKIKPKPQRNLPTPPTPQVKVKAEKTRKAPETP